MTEKKSDFTLYRTLLALREMVESYPLGERALGERVRDLTARLEEQDYRVAVIGEFKRGKSSLINALLGSEVLPTDILPMTAAVNRIVYDPEKKLRIHMKDGSTREAGLEELSRYATKADEEKARMAGLVREIEVGYPSVFCKNHIELLDTPGLNDDEEMTAATLGVLGEVDAAIVVLSALLPLSMTERFLIERLLERPEIRRILFVVTFLDAVSPRAEEQDRAVAFIRERLQGETLDGLREEHREEPELVRKAEAVLKDPVIFPVSSTLAMKGFLQDREALVEESRFPALKYGLTEILTAWQSTALQEQVEELGQKVSLELEGWYLDKRAGLLKEQEEGERALEECLRYGREVSRELEKLLLDADRDLRTAGLDPKNGVEIPPLAAVLRRYFISRLSALRWETDTGENIALALREASREALEEMEKTARLVEEKLDGTMETCRERIQRLRAERGLAQAGERLGVSLPAVSAERPDGGLVFSWQGALWPAGESLEGADVMPAVSRCIVASLGVFQRQFRERLAAWRLSLLRQGERDRAWIGCLEAGREERRREAKLALDLAEKQYLGFAEKAKAFGPERSEGA